MPSPGAMAPEGAGGVVWRSLGSTFHHFRTGSLKNHTARQAPVMGASQKSHQPVQMPLTTEGPRLRAGFVLVPDRAPSSQTMIQ